MVPRTGAAWAEFQIAFKIKKLVKNYNELINARSSFCVRPFSSFFACFCLN